VILLRSSVTNAAAIGVIIMSVIMMCKSRFPYVVMVPDMFSAPYLIQMSYQISDVIEDENAVSANTLILVFSVFSLSAILHIFMPSFRTLRFAEYLPYPVFCGLFSAVGLTIVQRSILFAPGYQIIPTCVVATSLSLKIFNVKESRPALTFVTVSFISTSVFYITAHFMGLNITDLRAIGWLVESPKRGNLTGQLVPWLLWTQGDAHVHFKTVQFTTILVKCGPNICYLLILIALRRSMQFANLNRLFSCRAKTNYELSLHGYSQLFAASLGTFGGVFSGPDMVRVKRMHGGEVFPGVIFVLALSCVTFSRFFGVDCVPKFVFTGIFASEGIMMLDRFLLMPYRLAGTVEWLAVVIIAVTAFFDIFKGFFVGAAISLILFSIRFHRTGCVKSTGTGLTIRSTVDRSDAAAVWLSSHGEKVRIIRLRGSVAFATVPALLDVVADILYGNQDKSKPLNTPQGKFLIWFSKLRKQIVFELLKCKSVSNCIKCCCDKKKSNVNKYRDNIDDKYRNKEDVDVDNDYDYDDSDRNRYDDNDYYEKNDNKKNNINHNDNKINNNNCNNSDDNNNVDNNYDYHYHSYHDNSHQLKTDTPHRKKFETSIMKVKHGYDDSNNDSIENHHNYPKEKHSKYMKEHSPEHSQFLSAEHSAMTQGMYRCQLHSHSSYSFLFNFYFIFFHVSSIFLLYFILFHLVFLFLFVLSITSNYS
jgi:MFS superfamily sulfate permease-like transporter